MKILGLDSSGLVASVAIAEDDNLLGEYTVNYKKTHSQTLLPMLDEVARMIELDLSSIDAIAVAGGPGSFTGLRIGSATAKVWDSRWRSRSSMCRRWTHLHTIWWDTGIWYARLWTQEEIRPIPVCTVLMETTCRCCAESVPWESMRLRRTSTAEVRRSYFWETVYRFLRHIWEERYGAAFLCARTSEQAAGRRGCCAWHAVIQRGENGERGGTPPEYLRLSQAERERKEQEATKRKGKRRSIIRSMTAEDAAKVASLEAEIFFAAVE